MSKAATFQPNFAAKMAFLPSPSAGKRMVLGLSFSSCSFKKILGSSPYANS